MATAVLGAPPPPPPPPRPVQRFTVEQYHKLVEVGVLTTEHRCELIRGYIVEKPVINPPHATAVRRLLTRLLPLSSDVFVAQSQQPVTFADSEPEPDHAIVRGPDDKFVTRHPRASECLFLVEVADTSLHEDQTDKLVLYAEANVPVYWVVNIPDRRVEVYTEPRGGKSPIYRTRTDYAPGQSVPVVLAGQTVGSIPVSELLP